MKILIASNCNAFEIYAGAFTTAFEKLGVKVKNFCWKNYFFNDDISKVKKLLLLFQYRYMIGPTVTKMNQDLILECKKQNPNLLFIYRGSHIYPATISTIKRLGIKVFGYNNDDPFSRKYPFYYWRYFMKSLIFYDWIFAYRQANVEQYKKIGYKNVSLLRSYYIQANNFPMQNIQKKYDVVFIGHWEDDGRDEAIKHLLDNGVKVKLFGTLWERSKYYTFFQTKYGDIKPLYGKAYNQTINESKIALVFLSKLNNDTYTRRCFEIPATKTMMIAEYTDDLANNLFEEDKEAVYFKNKEELLEKAQFYLNKEEKIKEIGENGYKRLIKDGHEVVDRCKEILKVYKERAS